MMRLYRACWLAGVLGFAVVGCALVPFGLSFGGFVAVTLIGFCLLLVAGCVLYAESHEQTLEALPVAPLVGVAAAGGVLVAAALSLVALAGFSTLPLALVLVLTCPSAVRDATLIRLGIVARSQPEQPKQPDASEPVRTEPQRPEIPVGHEEVAARPPWTAAMCAEASIERLCWWWRLSYVLLQQADGPYPLSEIAEARHLLLVQLAHRDPAGFARWVDDGARAASDPSRYFVPAPSPQRTRHRPGL